MSITEESTAKDCTTSDQDADQSRAVQQCFDAASARWADYYDQQPDTLSRLDKTVRLQAATQMLNVACDEVEGPIAILDVGCGTGEGTSRLSLPRVKCFAADFSAAMLERAVRRHPSLRGCAADAVALPFSHESFDIVLSLGVLEYIPAYERAVREFRRVLKPSGTLILSIPNRASWFRGLHRVERMLTFPARRVRARLRGVSEEDAGLTETFRHRSWTLGEAGRLLQVSGFLPIESKLITYGWLFPKARKWWVNLAFCRWMNVHCNGAGTLARHLACTTVIRARAV